MKYQYSICALLEVPLNEETAARLLQTIENIDEIIELQPLQNDNHQKMQLKAVANCAFDILQLQIQSISRKFEIDLILQSWQHKDIKPGLLIMDMDSTLVQAETIDEIARVAGVGEKVAEITESAMRGELDFTESLYARVAMLKGISLTAIEDVHQSLPLTEGAVSLLQKAHNNGCHTALVSGGFTMFAGPIAETLAFDTLSANTLEVVDEILTGKVVGKVVDGESKLATLERLKQELGLETQQIIAIGDGANDLPMLSAAGTGIAFHAKPKVQQQAKTILNYNNLNAVCWMLDW